MIKPGLLACWRCWSLFQGLLITSRCLKVKLLCSQTFKWIGKLL